MARDYKSSGRKKSAGSTPAWLWALIGLVTGLLIALMLYLGGYTAHDGHKTEVTPVNPPEKQETDARAVRKVPEPIPIPEPPPAKPRFDFYTILPEMEVPVPEQEVSGGSQQQVQQPGTYVLQAGSFRSFEEADRLKASLILLGIQASIQKVTVNNKDTWHRVQIGPYKDLAELNRVRTRLKQNHIETVLLKIKA